jgi:hypothetical protein
MIDYFKFTCYVLSNIILRSVLHAQYQSYTDISIQFLYKKIWTNFPRLFSNADQNIDS